MNIGKFIEEIYVEPIELPKEVPEELPEEQPLALPDLVDVPA